MEGVDALRAVVDSFQLQQEADQKCQLRQLCSLNRMGPVSVVDAKAKFNEIVAGLEKTIVQYEAATSKLPEGPARTRKLLQLKELARPQALVPVRSHIDKLKTFTTYDTDQRELKIEERLGVGSLAAPAQVAAVASKVGLEIDNSLGDEKKIYLNNEDLLIELNYESKTEGQLLDIDILFTENEEEVKLPEVAADILASLQNGTPAAVEDKLRALIRRTTLSVALSKQSPPIRVRLIEAELEKQIAASEKLKSLGKVAEGFELEFPVTYTMSPSPLAAQQRKRQRVIVGFVANGNFEILLSPPIPVPHDMATYINELAQGRQAEQPGSAVDSYFPSVLSFQANTADLQLASAFDKVYEIETRRFVDDSLYLFRVVPASADATYKAPSVLHRIGMDTTTNYDVKEAVKRLENLKGPLSRLLVLNSVLTSCLRLERQTFVARSKVGSSGNASQVKRRRIFTTADKAHESESAYARTVRVDLSVRPGEFLIVCKVDSHELVVKVDPTSTLHVTCNGIDESTLQRLNSVVRLTHSLVMLVHSYCQWVQAPKVQP